MNELKKPPRIVFVTAHSFGISALKGLLSAKAGGSCLEVVHLVTLSETHESVTVGYIKRSAEKLTINVPETCIEYQDIDKLEHIILTSKPDFLLVIGWSRLIPGHILNIPATLKNSSSRHGKNFGAIGMHPTILPQGRGRAPIPWTILHGLEKSGVTCFHLEDSADSGGIIAQEHFLIDKDETSTTLFEKCDQAHFKLGELLGMKIGVQNVTSIPQNEKLATIWEKRIPSDSFIKQTATIQEAEKLIRASAPPYPRAFFSIHNEKVFIEKSKITYHKVRLEDIGKIIDVDLSTGEPTIALQGGILKIQKFIGVEPLFFIANLGAKINET